MKHSLAWWIKWSRPAGLSSRAQYTLSKTFVYRATPYLRPGFFIRQVRIPIESGIRPATSGSNLTLNPVGDSPGLAVRSGACALSLFHSRPSPVAGSGQDRNAPQKHVWVPRSFCSRRARHECNYASDRKSKTGLALADGLPRKGLIMPYTW